MDISHNFRFRWNDHVPHLSQVFSELRFEEVYCDTTLITEDGFIMKAHGAVLITTSRYFERVLADVTPDQHPIIVLKGINYEELSFLLDYIYQGVTQVDQHLMESVLDVADLLEIKGLSKMKNNLSLKKLLAPSVSSATEARDSPSCSSSSKSPSPLSPQSPNSPSSDVYVQSFSLKTDHEEMSDDIAYENSKTRLNYVEKSVGTERSFDTSEYVASTSSKHPVLSSEYLDQTLGIDLSLSRGSCEENVKNPGKNSNIQEEAPLRKRKIMHSDEGPSTSELNSKYEEEKMPEGLILHQKKKVFSRPVCHSKSVPSCTQEESLKSNGHFTLENISSLVPRDKHDTSVNKPKNVMNFDDDSHPVSDSHVEVLCSDGALTISVTADSSHHSLNSLNPAQLSLSLKKVKKKKWKIKREKLIVKRESLESKKKANEHEDPESRVIKRLKSHAIQTDSYMSEPLSVHCDPPFPSEDEQKQMSSIKNKFQNNLDEDKMEREKESTTTEDEEVCSALLTAKKSNKINEDRKTRNISCISPLTLFTLPPAKEKEKQTRTTLTLEEKIKVIQAFLDGKSQRQIANLHGIGKTQVNGIVKKREEILSLYRESVVRGEKLTMKRQRKSEYATLNEHLIKWYRHMTVVAGVKITTGMLRAKALQIAPQLGYQDFKASNGWLATFKSNNNLKFSKVKKSESFSNETFDDTETQKENEMYEEEIEEGNSMNNADNSQISVVASSSEGISSYSVGLHLGSMRGESDTETIPTCQPPPPPVSNIAIGNSLLTSSGPLPKPPQMSNMALGSNIAYNLSREHTRTDLTHLSDIHTASSVNAPPPPLTHPSHPSLPKPPEAALSYKTEDALSYGYESQGRMNESTSRGTEYNYTHYGFPSTYYGYHFLGQY